MRAKRRGKGGKYKKNSDQENKLAQSEVIAIIQQFLVGETIYQVEFLVKHTAYNSEEVVDWHNAFLEDNPEGTLGKVTIPRIPWAR